MNENNKYQIKTSFTNTSPYNPRQAFFQIEPKDYFSLQQFGLILLRAFVCVLPVLPLVEAMSTPRERNNMEAFKDTF